MTNVFKAHAVACSLQSAGGSSALAQWRAGLGFGRRSWGTRRGGPPEPVPTFAPCWRGRAHSGRRVGLHGPALCPCRFPSTRSPGVAQSPQSQLWGCSAAAGAPGPGTEPRPPLPVSGGLHCSEAAEAQCASSKHIKLEGGGGGLRSGPGRWGGRMRPPRGCGPSLCQALCTFGDGGDGVSERAGQLVGHLLGLWNYGPLGLVLLEGRAVLSGLRSSLGPL